MRCCLCRWMLRCRIHFRPMLVVVVVARAQARILTTWRSGSGWRRGDTPGGGGHGVTETMMATRTMPMGTQMQELGVHRRRIRHPGRHQ